MKTLWLVILGSFICVSAKAQNGLLNIDNLKYDSSYELPRYSYDFTHLLHLMYPDEPQDDPLLANIVNERAPFIQPKLYDGLFESWYNTTSPSNLDELQMAFTYVRETEGILLDSVDRIADTSERKNIFEYYELLKSGMRADAIVKYGYVFTKDTLIDGGTVFYRDLDGSYSDKIDIDRDILNNGATPKSNEGNKQKNNSETENDNNGG